MGEAIITRRGGAGEVIVEFENFTPSDTVVGFHPDGELVRSTPTALSVARGYRRPPGKPRISIRG